jgi:hypothetical protein
MCRYLGEPDTNELDATAEREKEKTRRESNERNG